MSDNLTGRELRAHLIAEGVIIPGSGGVWPTSTKPYLSLLPGEKERFEAAASRTGRTSLYADEDFSNSGWGEFSP